MVNLHLAREVFDLNPERFKSAAALVTIDAMDEITLREAHQTLTIGSADPEIADLLEDIDRRADRRGALRRHR